MGKIFDYDGVPVLHTTSGDLKGYFYDGVYIYKGIPYAYADRFQMPVPSKWDGVKDATNYGFVCPLQNQETPSAELMVPHRYWPQDEHCQSLNIWTSKLDPEAKKPVLVWFHGGGYAAGCLRRCQHRKKRRFDSRFGQPQTEYPRVSGSVSVWGKI